MTVQTPGEPATWFSEGAQLNPLTTTVFASTGQVTVVGNYQAHITISTDAAAVINIQWRNAADAANNKEQRIYFAASQTAEFIFPMRIDAINERVRVIPNANVTGSVSASIHWQKLA